MTTSLKTLNASNLVGTVNTANLGSGTADATVYLRGDNTWQPTASLSGGTWAPCRVGTTAALTATYANGTAGVGATLTNSGTLAALAIDGVTLAVGNRVLVKNQGSQLQNGIYTVTNIGSASVAWVLTRATDCDQPADIVEGDSVVTAEGSTQACVNWIMISWPPFTVGTTALAFSAQAATAAGSGLSSNLIMLSNGTNAPLTASSYLSFVPSQNLLTLQGGSIQSNDVFAIKNNSGAVQLGITSTYKPHGNLAMDQFTCRLSGSSTDPLPSADQTAITTICLVPCQGRGLITLYNGTDFETWSTSGTISLALGFASAANTNYDIYVYSTGSALTLAGVAWTNNTTRAVTPVQTVGDFWSHPTNTGWRYVGTIRTTVANQTEDSQRNRFIYNFYNQAPRRIYYQTPTSSWTYAASAWRYREGGTGLDFQWVNGTPNGRGAYYNVMSMQRVAGSGGSQPVIGIAMDSANPMIYSTGSPNNIDMTIVCFHSIANAGVGYHFMSQVEAIWSTLATTTFSGGGSSTITGTMNM